MIGNSKCEEKMKAYLFLLCDTSFVTGYCIVLYQRTVALLS